MKKILFITTGHSLDDDRVSRKEAVSLAKLGHDITVVGQYSSRYIEPLIKMVDINTLEYVAGDNPPKRRSPGRMGRCFSARQLYRACKKFSPDLVVAHEFESAVCAFYVKKHLGIPYVFDDHEAYDVQIPLIAPKIIQGIVRWLIREIIRSVVYNSEGITSAVPRIFAYQEALRVGKPACVIYNSPLLSHFPYSEAEDGTIQILHEGNLSFDRGAIEMVDALAIVKKSHDFKFKIVGSVSDDVAAVLPAKIKSLGLEHNVEFCGRYPWDKLGEIDKTAQIGLCCLQRTHNCVISLACKLFSYMACGLAVIGMEKSETENLIRDAKNGICVDTTSPEEIAKAIIYLIEHPGERCQMARNGRKAIEEKYSWERMEVVLKEFYADVLERAN